MNEILNIRNVHCYMDNQTATAYLNAESDDDTVVEHSEGQTINISHANVVIFD